MKEKVGEGLY